MKIFNFPTGESHVDFCEPAYPALLTIPMQANINDYLMSAMVACDALNRARRGQPFDLFIPYLPYSRQDRPTGIGEPFSLKIIGQMLNSTAAETIYTLDVHSDAAYGCIDRLKNIPQKFFVEAIPCIQNEEVLTLVVPDQGAAKKAASYQNHFDNVAIAIKHRDEKTGQLRIEHLTGEVSGQDCLIVDDICDGGGTFILLADELYKRGAASVSLAITHGVFTKGLKPLYDAGIKRIFTTDSFTQDKNPEIELISKQSLLERFL